MKEYVKCLGKVTKGLGNCTNVEFAFGSYLFTISCSYTENGRDYCRSHFALVPSSMVSESHYFVSTGTPVLSDFIINDSYGLEILANCFLLHLSAF